MLPLLCADAVILFGDASPQRGATRQCSHICRGSLGSVGASPPNL